MRYLKIMFSYLTNIMTICFAVIGLSEVGTLRETNKFKLNIGKNPRLIIQLGTFFLT